MKKIKMLGEQYSNDHSFWIIFFYDNNTSFSYNLSDFQRYRYKKVTKTLPHFFVDIFFMTMR